MDRLRSTIIPAPTKSASRLFHPPLKTAPNSTAEEASRIRAHLRLRTPGGSPKSSLESYVQAVGRAPQSSAQTRQLRQLQRSYGNAFVNRLIRGSGTAARTRRQADRFAKGNANASIQRRIGDGHDLTSPRFSGDAILEACFDNERVLTTGARGDAVRKVQQALIDAGFALPKFGADGSFGSETRTAVRAFQQSSGLKVDGIVGPLTMGALDARFSGPTPPVPPVPVPPVPPVPPPTPPLATITTETVKPNPAPRNRILIGVGEQVKLTHSAGSATTAWTTTGGRLSSATGPSVILTAPDLGQLVFVSAGGVTVMLVVIAPTGVHMDSIGGVRHEPNRPRVGMLTQPFLLPDTVNFSNVTYHELDVLAVANGTYSCHNGNVGHCGNGTGACGDLFLTDTVVATKGTQTVRGDCVDSGDCITTAPFTPGTISFAIPYEYKIGAGAFHRFATVAQVMTLAADASTLTADKAGAHVTTTVAAGQVINPGCP